MSKRPSFQFYPNDWLSCEKVAMMTPAEEGAYIRLLCFCWKSEDCSIPDDDEKLAVLSRMGEGWFKGGSTVVRACFMPFPSKAGFLTHKRLLEERKKQDEWRRKSAEGGRKSAASRKGGELKGGSKMVATKSQPKGNTSSSSSSSKINIYTHEFEAFWSVYPNKVDKAKAFSSFKKNVLTGELACLLEAVEKYVADCTRVDRSLRHPTTFLNNDWKQWLTFQQPQRTRGVEI